MDWCGLSGMTPAWHAGDFGFKSRRVHYRDGTWGSSKVLLPPMGKYYCPLKTLCPIFFVVVHYAKAPRKEKERQEAQKERDVNPARREAEQGGPGGAAEDGEDAQALYG